MSGIERSAQAAGLRAAYGWQRGNPLPKPPEDFEEYEIRDWVRGWNAGVANRA